MTGYQENYLTMFKVVKTTITPYTAAIDAIPAFMSHRLRFFVIIDELGSAVQKQGVDVSGQTEEKKVRRQKMSDAAFAMGQVISAYAISNNKLALDAEVNHPMSAFNRLRDEEVAEFCNTILFSATTNLPALGDFGITQVNVDALKDLIANYSDNSQVNTVSWQKKIAQSQTIINLINEGKGILNNGFDKLIVLFRTSNAELFNAYTEARNSMPKRHAKKSNGEITNEVAGILTGTVTDKADKMPIQGAIVKLTGTTFTAETDSDGEYLFDTLPAGSYNLEISLLDYVTATLAAQAVLAGDETVADFEMVKKYIKN